LAFQGSVILKSDRPFMPLCFDSDTSPRDSFLISFLPRFPVFGRYDLLSVTCEMSRAFFRVPMFLLFVLFDCLPVFFFSFYLFQYCNVRNALPQETEVPPRPPDPIHSPLPIHPPGLFQRPVLATHRTIGGALSKRRGAYQSSPFRVF